MNVLRFPALQAKVGGLSKAQIDRLEAKGKFPRRIRIGERAVGWLELDVDLWLKAKAAERSGIA
jgi:prophage regulatory protein